jgi:hypothetical protein
LIIIRDNKIVIFQTETVNKENFTKQLLLYIMKDNNQPQAQHLLEQTELPFQVGIPRGLKVWTLRCVRELA